MVHGTRCMCNLCTYQFDILHRREDAHFAFRTRVITYTDQGVARVECRRSAPVVSLQAATGPCSERLSARRGRIVSCRLIVVVVVVVRGSYVIRVGTHGAYRV